MVFAATLHGAPDGRIRITLTGREPQRGHLELAAGSVTYSKGGSTYRGPVTTIRGDSLGATLTGPGGRFRIAAHLAVQPSRAFPGRVTLS